jgi:hypothetical protein
MVVVMVGFQILPKKIKPCNLVLAKLQKKKKKKKKFKKEISTNTTPMIKLS